jgi:hypothetical protein
MEGEDPNNPGYMLPVKPSKVGIDIGNENVQRLLKYQAGHSMTWAQVEAMLKDWIIEKLDALDKL